jgi:pantoate--beta-alanine ligase
LQVLRTIPELRAAILERRLGGDSVGFVPTMGVLHEGQLSLVRRAHAENGCVVVSSFTNPGDFPALDEASAMRRDEHRDLALLERDGGDLVFVMVARSTSRRRDAGHREGLAAAGGACGPAT